MRRELPDLIQALDYQFSNEELIRHALTHRSVSGGMNNERLEFLGDSILNFVIAAELFVRYPDVPEGDLSRLRASLVNKDMLARLATQIDLGEWLLLGSGEAKSGGFRRKSILADALEAIFGAVLIDGGIDAAKAVILNLYGPVLNNVIDLESLKDPKTRLQEFLQARKQALPVYQLVETSGKPHLQQFTVKCIVELLEEEILGTGSSRRKAEQQAAERALDFLHQQVI